MSEVAFPLLGAALVIGLVMPATAVLVRLVLVALGRATPIGGLHGLALRYFLIVGVAAVPVAWFSSAAAHQAETGRSVLACILDHGADSSCLEPRLFSLMLLGAIAALAVPTLVRTAGGSASLRDVRGQPAHPRVAATIDALPHLAFLRGRVHVSADSTDPIATRGVIRPAVMVRESWLDAVDDAALAAALAHEAEHVRGRDPLRYLLLSLCSVVNPLGAIVLRPEVHRWIAAREVQCDRLAVSRGADPTALAHALVLAARPDPAMTAVAALEPTDLGTLHLRVSLLLAYAEQPERVRCETTTPTLSLAFVLVVVVAALPHMGSTAALDALHVGTELAVASFLP
jgi:beta-lactamase regulating signal transducer with metallopeptidase domain